MGCPEELLRENGAHRCANAGRIIGVDGWAKENQTCSTNRFASPDHSSQITGRLNGLQSQPAMSPGWIYSFKISPVLPNDRPETLHFARKRHLGIGRGRDFEGRYAQLTASANQCLRVTASEE